MKNHTDRLAAKQGSGLDLSSLGDLASMLQAPVAAAQSSGSPKMFDLDHIREDEGNFRTEGNPGFTDESIAELAESMSEGRGVKSPLSLRPDPNAPGFYIINHGHRRYRAAKVAGLVQVPAFVDEGFDKFDQVIENIQREALTSREIADFIGSAQAEGHSLTDIARLLGKSKAFVSQHVALLDLPEPVARVFQEGQIKDVTLVNELVRAHRENPEVVEATLAQPGDCLAAKQLTRAKVKSLRKKVHVEPTQAINADDLPSDASQWQGVAERLSALPGVSVKVDALPGGAIELRLVASGAAALQALVAQLGIGAGGDSPFSC
ncbi:ParB/RepB/Spo0J family partition protein [Pusillimonas minor]|uniref:ParB/RepB/Spo0J family partition protein n=1 Tax=Pusillimonas minor TaxID=2697024 RepID=A0A842HUG2_9BURK|nr:ParB/RepB/Spo0J family partition protein [Pusillimonas minor]MBC2771060.1 ParB/RepB/Spo0J family partition protein [Pusillimonas minor]